MMALAVVSLFAPHSGQPLCEVSLLSLWFLLISLICLSAWTLLGKAANRVCFARRHPLSGFSAGWRSVY